jgi:triosephosphate isomerase
MPRMEKYTMVSRKKTARRPLALSNWKMAMTVAESLAFVRQFEALAGDLLEAVDVVICPPFTALWAVAEALRGSRLQLGAQNVAPTADLARTGEISAALLADAGCRWVMLGHWEVRRYQGDDDAAVNRKVRLAFEAGLWPMLLIGEARDDPVPLEVALDRQLGRVLEGCRAEQVAKAALVYEPEGAIGVSAPASPAHVTVGCAFMRGWLRERWGEAVAERVRVVYGGSVSPEHAPALLAAPDLDGLGATRRGRDPASFVEIVRQIALRCC